MDAYFYNEEDANLFNYPERKIYHYDFHNLLGFSMGIATKKALTKLGHKLTYFHLYDSFYIPQLYWPPLSIERIGYHY